MMKTVIKTGDIVLGDVAIKGIEVEQHYDACDAIKLMNFGKQFVKELTQELPEMVSTLMPIIEKFETNANEDDRRNRKEIFSDRRELMFITLKLDEAEKHIDSCNGMFDQTTVDVAYGLLDKVEEMYFNLNYMTDGYIEDRILELTKRIEGLQ